MSRDSTLSSSRTPSRFLLVEAYRTTEAIAAHKETAHYAAWRDLVASMMAEPRSSVKFTNVFPADDEYGTPGAAKQT